jgi:hypothetical protein
MAFIGNTNTTQAFTPAIDYFSGNGSTTAFTLTRPVASVAQVQVVVNNVAQNPSSAFSVSGSTITFTSAPSAGTSNIYVYYTSPITQIIAPGQNTVNSSSLANGAATQIFLDSASATGTGAMKLPVGTTAERPTGAAGLIRSNSTTGEPEWYDAVNAAWLPFRTGPIYSVSYLVASGGGGGAYASNSAGGGGGAGGLLTSTASLTPGTAYTITIGAGGAGSTTAANGSNGSSSVLASIATSVGGGGAGYGNAGASGSAGSAGGSGGGGGQCTSGTFAGGAGTAGQGFAGGNSTNTSGASGGGGAGAVGGNATAAGAVGGIGVASSISGTSTYYSGGGGGASNTGSVGGAGGLGGGGRGGSYSGTTTGVAGTANTGGGGGGSGAAGTVSGAAGGSGVVILSYLGAQRGTGGTVTSSGGYTIHTFTSSGTYVA